MNFIIRTQIKTRSAKSVKQSQIFQGQYITPIQSTLSNNDKFKNQILFQGNYFGAFILT